MKLSAQANYIRMSPRKVQLVTRLIAGLPVIEARAQLAHSPKLASTPVAKLLDSAVANALNQLDIKEDDLFVKTVSADQGPTLHRYKPRAFGRAGKIRKRTSHLTVTLGIRDEAGIDLEKAKKTQTIPEKPTNLEDVQKELEKEAKKQKASKNEDVKEEKITKQEEKAESKEQSKAPAPAPKHAPEKSGGKGSDGKFMKKIFSRKVG